MASLDQQPNAEVAEVSQKTRNFENEISHAVIGCAVEVQKHLGTGLLESAYCAALAIELQSRGLAFEREAAVSATYKGQPLGVAYRADFIVENRLLLEVKAVEALNESHRAQVLSYLRLGGFGLGLLMNFHAFPLATRGVSRVVNQL